MNARQIPKEINVMLLDISQNKMTNKNSTCQYLIINCGDETRGYDNRLCYGDGNPRNCATYQKIAERFRLIQNQVQERTPERKRNTLAVLIDDPRQIGGRKN